MHLYYLDRCWAEEPLVNWQIARLFRPDQLLDPINSMNGVGVLPGVVVEGWHLAYMGGVDAIRAKLDNICHPELNSPEFSNRAHLEKCLRDGLDLFMRDDEHTIVPTDNVPQYALENRDRFNHLFYPCESSSQAHLASSEAI